MRNTALSGFCIIFVLISVFSTAAVDILDDQVYAPSARTSALGGLHAAFTDDLSTLFNNPAGFRKADPEMSVAELTFRIGGPVFDIAGVVASGVGGGTEDLLTSPDIQDLLQGIYASFNLLGPISFGYVGKGMGFGFFNTSDIEISNSSPLTIETAVSESLILCGGYSFRIPLPAKSNSTLDIGVLMKGALKGKVLIEKSFLEFPTLISNLGTDTFLGEPFQFIGIIGFDAGILYSYKDILSVGLTGRDLYSPALISEYSSITAFYENTETPTKSNELLPLDLSVGVAFTPSLGSFERYITDLSILLDYSDILDFWLHPSTATNPLLHIGFGTEVTLLNILSIRVGFNEGLFAAGLGLDLTIFTLNAAMFGSENASEPGQNSVYNVMLGFEFRL